MTQSGLVSDASQRLANQYSNLFKVFMRHSKSVKVVTLWGVKEMSRNWRVMMRLPQCHRQRFGFAEPD